MCLEAICVDQATRGIPGPPGHVPVAPSDGWQGRWCWRAGGSSHCWYHLVFSSDNSTHLLCLKAELPRQWYTLTTNYFYYDSFFFTFFFFLAFWDSLALQPWLTLKSLASNVWSFCSPSQVLGPQVWVTVLSRSIVLAQSQSSIHPFISSRSEVLKKALGLCWWLW